MTKLYAYTFFMFYFLCTSTKDGNAVLFLLLPVVKVQAPLLPAKGLSVRKPKKCKFLIIVSFLFCIIGLSDCISYFFTSVIYMYILLYTFSAYLWSVRLK